MKKRIGLATGWMVLLAAMASRLFAQGLPLELKAEDSGKSTAMVLEKLKVEAVVFGPLAETKMTMTFRNPHDRQLAGDLNFPLPEGAFVSGYALDINGIMVDGVVVEKEKARQVFEALTRQRIDPGLVEWSGGNNFKTRVFPLPARGTRTIMVRYVSELVINSEGTFFLLPMGYPQKVPEFSLRLEVLADAGQPIIKKSGFANTVFKKWQGRFVAGTEQKDATLREDLLVQLPGDGKPEAWVEKDSGGEYHFLISDWPEAKNLEPLLAAPRRVSVFWDASASRRKSNHEREFQILIDYFSRQKDRRLVVDLTVFRNEPEKPRRFAVEHGDATELITALRNLAYDGGTQLGCLRPATPRPDFYLLFSDGLTNFGREEPPALGAPLYALCGDAAANHSLLHYLAEAGGGRYFNLTQSPPAEVVPQIGRPPFRFLALQTAAGAVAEVLPGHPQPASGRVLIAGKLQADEAAVTAVYGYGNGAALRREFRLRRADAVAGRLLRIHWAQKKIEELLILSQKNENELVAIGRKYGLVTPGTSLIVLDNLSQYLQYRILPPETLPDLRREYLEAVESQRREQKELKREKLDWLTAEWNRRIAWWMGGWKKPAKKAPPPPRSGWRPVPDQSPTPTNRITIRPGAGQVISGTVSAPDGAPLPGAVVTLTSGQRTFSTVTDENGKYVFRGLGAGTYSLTAYLEGFNKTTLSDIRVESNRAVEANIALHMGAIMEEVTVSGSAPTSRSRGTWAVDGVDDSGARRLTVAIEPWNPDTPYLQQLKAAAPEKAYDVYLEQRERYGGAPAFYIDCANHFFAAGQNGIGLRILSTIAELELESGQLLRILGQRLRQQGLLELSRQVFEKVLALRPEEPQSWRDLALVLAELKRYRRAIELLNHVVMAEWDDRFEGIELVALMELNDVIAKAQRAGQRDFAVAPALIRNLDVDIRIVLNWDADQTDIDLWVIEPTEEKAYYGQKQTSLGGLVSNDFQEGYGPEEYLLRRAARGKYKIQIDYYGSDSVTLIGPVTVWVDIYTHFGRANERKKSLWLRLDRSEDNATVGEIGF